MSSAVADRPKESFPAISGPRLPYHPAIQERFGIDIASWRALVEAIFPGATSIDSIIMVLSYCRARKLDPFKRVVHIVPIWNKEQRRMVDTVWPGIGELRTTAFRTGEYAGRGETVFGPDVTKRLGSIEITFPEWAQCTVYRMVKGQRVSFAGPRVYWQETYATTKRDDDTPNEMWQTRTRGQIDKCAEAAALRAAFPEEIGGDYIPEEVQHNPKGTIIESTTVTPVSNLDALTDELRSSREQAVEQTHESSELSDAVEASQLPFGVASDGEILSFDEKRFQTEIDGCDTADAIRAAAGAAIDLYPNDAKVLSAISGIEKTALDRLTNNKKPQQRGLPVTA